MTWYNYEFHRDIQKNRVDHPEGLPNIMMAKTTSFWFQNVRADWYRLETIQYIGSNAIGAEYKKYLYKVLELVTWLNPYFEHPYVIGELLLPSFNGNYEKISASEQKRNLREAEKLGLLWMKNFCNSWKIDEIEKEYDLKKLWTDPYYKDTCKSYEIPFYLAYIYYFYKHDPITASWYYRVTSTHKDALEWAKTMAAIMQWKWGEREKSLLMFLNLAKSFEKDDELCQKFVIWLEELMGAIKNNKTSLNGKIIEQVQKVQKEVFWEFDEKEETKKLSDTTCSNYANKAVRELNLMYIEQANEKYKNNNDGKDAKDAKILFKAWYLDFLPTDFQQYKDYGIIYEYNPETQWFDYNMWTYQ
jgi:hypothetical protein